MYNHISDSSYDGGEMDSWDVITDFAHGIDKINLSSLTGLGVADDLAWGGTTATAHGVWYANTCRCI